MSVARLLLQLQQEEQAMLIVVTHSLELAGLLQQRRQLNEGQLVSITDHPVRSSEGGSAAVQFLRVVLRSWLYFWPMHATVACGVAAATAVLTGALLVGDSVRGSLRDLTLDRLGQSGRGSLCRSVLPCGTGGRSGSRSPISQRILGHGRRDAVPAGNTRAADADRDPSCVARSWSSAVPPPPTSLIRSRSGAWRGRNTRSPAVPAANEIILNQCAGRRTPGQGGR